MLGEQGAKLGSLGCSNQMFNVEVVLSLQITGYMPPIFHLRYSLATGLDLDSRIIRILSTLLLQISTNERTAFNSGAVTFACSEIPSLPA